MSWASIPKLSMIWNASSMPGRLFRCSRIIGDGSCSCLELADIMGGNEGFAVGGRKFVGNFSERKNGIESEGKFTRTSKMGDG